MRKWSFGLSVCALLFLAGCSSAYYGTLEQFGVHKRDILVDRVEDARDSQTKAKEQFNSALEEFSALVNYDGGNLQATYEKLDAEYNRSVAAADDVNNRISAIKRVSKDLFSEWESELDRYSNQNLRKQSEKKLKATQREYKKLITAMDEAKSKIPPVLEVFEDQVLFLKHNLNAQAVAALKAEYQSMQSNVGDLLAEMEQSISEANAFIRQLEK